MALSLSFCILTTTHFTRKAVNQQTAYTSCTASLVFTRIQHHSINPGNQQDTPFNNSTQLSVTHALCGVISQQPSPKAPQFLLPRPEPKWTTLRSVVTQKGHDIAAIVACCTPVHTHPPLLIALLYAVCTQVALESCFRLASHRPAALNSLARVQKGGVLLVINDKVVQGTVRERTVNSIASIPALPHTPLQRRETLDR